METIITNKCVPLRYVLISRLLWLCGFIRLVCFVADLHCTLHAPAYSFFVKIYNLKFKFAKYGLAARCIQP